MESLLFEELLPSAEEQVRGGQQFNQAATKALLNSGGSDLFENPSGTATYSFAQAINPTLFFDKVTPGGEVTITPVDPQKYTIAVAPELAKTIKALRMP